MVFGMHRLAHSFKDGQTRKHSKQFTSSTVFQRWRGYKKWYT